MKKLSDKNLFYIVALLCVVGLVMFFALGYKSVNDSCSSLKAQNNSIRNHISELQVYYDEKDQHIQEMDTLLKEVSTIISKFPVDIKSEDMITEAVDIYNTANSDGVKMVYNSMVFNDPDSVYEVSADVVKSANSEDYTEPISFNVKTANYTNDTTYDALKTACGAIFSSKYPVNLQVINYTLNEENGYLSGQMQLGFYYVSGTNREYVAPEFKSYTMGTPNIFANTIAMENGEQTTQE